MTNKFFPLVCTLIKNLTSMRLRPMPVLRIFTLSECESEAALHGVGRCEFLFKSKQGVAEGIMAYVAASAGKRLYALFICQGGTASVE